MASVERRAAIDVGTVTTRLLVADTDGTSVLEVGRRTVVTQLGRGLRASGSLAPDAIERVARAVADFASELTRLGVVSVVAVATSAARDADNRDELLGRLRAVGVDATVIPGAVEARLSFREATYGLDVADVLVADLGGGSTELVFGSAGSAVRTPGIERALSLDVGSRRVVDAFLDSDPPTAQEVHRAADWVSQEMRPFFESLPRCARTLVTLAGTGTTLSAIEQRLAVYDPDKVHGSRLRAPDIARLRGMLAGMTVRQRRSVTGMDPERADVIVGGAIILESILALSGLDETLVSEHDILYGLILGGPAALS